MTFDTYSPEPWHGKHSIFLTYLIWAGSHHIDSNWILSHWRQFLTGGLKRNSVLNYQLLTIESFPTVIRDDEILILNVEPDFLLFQNKKIEASLWTPSWNMEGSVCTKYNLHSTYVASMCFPAFLLLQAFHSIIGVTGVSFTLRIWLFLTGGAL